MCFTAPSSVMKIKNQDFVCNSWFKSCSEDGVLKVGKYSLKINVVLLFVMMIGCEKIINTDYGADPGFSIGTPTHYGCSDMILAN